jgi:hypothetical protein
MKEKAGPQAFADFGMRCTNPVSRRRADAGMIAA